MIASEAALSELQAVISKMSLRMCCAAVLPEFDLRWHNVSRTIRNNRQPMTPSSVAMVLKMHAQGLPSEDVEEILDKLRLKLVAVQERRWHTIILMDQVKQDPPAILSRVLASRIGNALKQSRAGKVMRPAVHTYSSREFIYVSVQLISESKRKPPLFVVVAPGQPVLFTSSLAATPLLKATVEGLGYQSCEDAQLSGQDIMSLLQIYNQNYTDNVNHLTEMPEYDPKPLITKNGIDYTSKNYDEKYIENLFGPNPPLRTDLTVESVKRFFDPSIMNKTMKVTMKLKCDNVAELLKTWVARKALLPNSDIIQGYLNSKSDMITCRDD